MSWKNVKLSSIVLELESGSRPKGGSLSAGLVSIGGTQISNDGGFKWHNMDYIPESFYEKLKNGIVQTNDVLIVKDGATTGKVAFVDDDFPFEKASINEHVFRLSADLTQADPKFIFYYLFTPTGQSEIQKDFRGATVGGISRQFIDLVTIPLPDLRTQQQIVAVLDKAQSLIRKREQSIQLLDELLKATFLDMFGDPSNNPKKLKIGTIRDLVENVKYGTSAKAALEGELPYLRMNNMTYEGYLDVGDLKYITLSEKDKKKYVVKRGDILFNRTNSRDLVGKTVVFDRNEEMVIAGYIVKSEAKKGISPYFIWGYLNSDHGKLKLKSICKSIVGMANINAQEFQDIPIQLPTSKLQNEYGNIVQKVLDNKGKLNTALENIQTLFQSLLQDAFAGKLKMEDDLPLDVILEQYQLGDTNQQEKERNQERIQLLANSTEKLAAFKKRLDKQEFENIDEYEKCKAVLFEVLNAPKSKLEQVYDRKTKKVVLN